MYSLFVLVLELPLYPGQSINQSDTRINKDRSVTSNIKCCGRCRRGHNVK